MSNLLSNVYDEDQLLRTDIYYEGNKICGEGMALNMSYRTFTLESGPSIIKFEGTAKDATFECMLDSITDNSIEILKLQKKLLKSAFKNRSKQYNFLLLNDELTNNLVTDEEYEKEIEDNPEKYVIEDRHEELKFSELKVLSSLVDELNAEKSICSGITVDEISELFEVTLDNLMNLLEENKNLNGRIL